MRLLIMGPPGSGKGTQATHLAAQLRIPAISTGDIFRQNVNDGTAMGRVAREYMEAGEYVPDNVTNAMVRDRLAQLDCEDGFLLDGYPRTMQQVVELDDILARADAGLDAVIELVVDAEVLVDRLLARASADGRTDDTAEVIRRRLELYHEQTSVLALEYEDRGVLRTVDGDGPVEVVAARISGALAARASIES